MKIQPSFRLFIFLFVSLCCHLSYAQTTPAVLTYESDATVTGLVGIEYFYEEPNYGGSPESDNIVGACMLKLDKNAKLKNGSTVQRMQLIFTKENGNKCSDIVGKRAEVTGTVIEVHTGHHHGDALLDLKSYKVLR